jgi:hypothetical protein
MPPSRVAGRIHRIFSIDQQAKGNTTMNKAIRSVAAISAAAMGLFAGAAAAQVQYIYGNSASSAAGAMYQINLSTGAVVKTCPQTKGNGRGIVVVGNTVYYTVATSNNVYKMDWPTCADQGVAFTVGAVSGIATIAYDGTDVWMGEYNSSGNRAFKYSLSGTLLSTITLPNCSSNCDGLEFFQGKLISNNDDGGSNYTIYSTAGAVMTANFIQTGSFSTGIAFDGTDFYVSFPTASPRTIKKYSGATGALLQTITITGMTVGADQIEDLSVDYNIVIPPGPPAPQVVIPTLSEWGLFLLAALLALSAYAARRRSR